MNVRLFHVDADRIYDVAYEAEMCKGPGQLKQVIAIYAGAEGGYTIISDDSQLDHTLEACGCARIHTSNPLWFLMSRHSLNFTFFYGNQKLIEKLQAV